MEEEGWTHHGLTCPDQILESCFLLDQLVNWYRLVNPVSNVNSVVKAAQRTDVFLVSHDTFSQLTSNAGGEDGKYRFK